MDVSEVRKLDAYLKKLFGNANIRVVPKAGDIAEVFVGEDDLGELTLDDEDGDRSYNFRMVIQVGNDPSIQPVPTLNAYLRRKFDNENIRVVVRGRRRRIRWKSISARNFSACCFSKSRKAASRIFSNCRFWTSIWSTRASSCHSGARPAGPAEGRPDGKLQRESGFQKQPQSLHLDSGSGAELVIGPRFARTRWHRPGLTVSPGAAAPSVCRCRRRRLSNRPASRAESAA